MLIRAQVRIPAFTLIPKDVMTNTWHFQSTEVTLAAAAAAIGTRLETFYESALGGTGRTASHYVWSSTAVWYYDMEAAPPRVPLIVSMPLTMSVSGSNLPAEVALVLSYAGDPISGIPQARRRGRIYLGGLGNMVQPGSASTWPAPSSAVLPAITAAASALAAPASSAQWSVFSPTQENASVGTGWTLVTNGFVGHEFDTQRRRQPSQTSRSTWT